ncbi:MAG: hypothetical protein AB2660_21275, partial [Candidatus Thiodiazotropha sp.]
TDKAMWLYTQVRQTDSSDFAHRAFQPVCIEGQCPAGDHPPVHQAGEGSKHQSQKGAFVLSSQQCGLEQWRKPFVSVFWPQKFSSIQRIISSFMAITTTVTASSTPWTVHWRGEASFVPTDGGFG